MRKTLLLITVLLCGCGLFEPEAEFKITDIQQSEGGLVTIYYTIDNTGNVDIDYYQVWFTVNTSAGKYTDWTNGTDVKEGNRSSGWTMVSTSGNQYTSVVISDYELESY